MRLGSTTPDIIVIDKQDKKVVVVDVAIRSYSNIRKRKHNKLEKCQGLKEEAGQDVGVKPSMAPVGIGAFGAVTPKLGEWLQ